ncbi:protein kinase-like protein 5 [Dinothrombium tinctorium]|uniref:Protein kinase-like protein 5 n=1 Tax=Dinothrombium tinctorium TaxID=1965070 RepID=A0A3S4RLM9_9ACAR|nr:protein kinase-like protein 5 [Dinothrombium tinctorium]
MPSDMLRTCQYPLKNETAVEFEEKKSDNEKTETLIPVEAKKELSRKNYEIVTILAESQFNKVIRIRDTSCRDLVAKVIDIARASKIYGIELSVSKLSVLRQIRHKYVNSVYEIIVSSKNVIILMKYQPKRTLVNMIASWRVIPESTCRIIASCMLQALHYFHHNLCIAHKHIKLQNFLLSDTMTPKLTDYCYSLRVTSNAAFGATALSGTYCASLPYTAPEIFESKQCDPRISDIWSFGVCLFFLLNGVYPFYFDDISILLNKQLNADFEFTEPLSTECKGILKKMLEPDPKKRITTSQLILNPWFLNEKELP